jgi:hypothetical protein
MILRSFFILVLVLPLTFLPVKAQTWEAFLSKHIDNLSGADLSPGRTVQYSEETIEKNKSELMRLIYQQHKGYFSDASGDKNPALYPIRTVYAKDQMSALIATLRFGTHNEKQNARNLMYNTMFSHGLDQRGRGISFLHFYISYILNLVPESFSVEKEADLRKEYAENWKTRFWAYNTENHCQMYRSTTYGVGLKWPEHNFMVRSDGSKENGTYIYRQIEENHIYNYIKYLFKYGMGENLSPVYMGTHVRPWTVFLELARHYHRQTAMEVSGAILEYYYALVGLNSQHGMHVGLVNRAMPELNRNYGYTTVARIFGGYAPGESISPGAGSLIADSDFVPHEKTRKIIAGDISMPYSIVQSIARNNWYQPQVKIEDSDASPIGFSIPQEYAKTAFRYSYVHRHYSIGSGNIKCLPGDSQDYGDGMAGSAAWENGGIFFSSPQRHITEKWGDKFFRDYKPGYSGNVKDDSWVGYSPYMEMAQFENTVLVYCVIPHDEPYKIAQVHILSPGEGESVIADDNNKTYYATYMSKDGMIYLAIIPMNYTGENQRASGFRNMERIVDDGSGSSGHCGYVVEIAHSSEISFDEFKRNANSAGVSWDKNSTRLEYTNSNGNKITLSHSSKTRRKDQLPTIEITPEGGKTVTVDWENYPVLRSPYMRIIHEDSREKLVINDNNSGIKIDFDGERVHYLDCDDFVPVSCQRKDLPNPFLDKLETGSIHGVFTPEDYTTWCPTVIRHDDEKYYLIASVNYNDSISTGSWQTNSELAVAVSDEIEGPYEFIDLILPRRDKKYWDGELQHNPMIRKHDDTYYLFYTGSTYEFERTLEPMDRFDPRYWEGWDNQRIGIATAKHPAGPWTQYDQPVIQPREGRWDEGQQCNPTAVMHDDGSVILMYKGTNIGFPDRVYAYDTATVHKFAIGVARADSSFGEYKRLGDYDGLITINGIQPRFDLEDPDIWFDGKYYHMLMKNFLPVFDYDDRGGCFYAWSENAWEWFTPSEGSVALPRTVTWKEGYSTIQQRIEKPAVFTENGKPVYVFAATIFEEKDRERFGVRRATIAGFKVRE